MNDELQNLVVMKNYVRLLTMPGRPKTYFKYMSADLAKVVLGHKSLRWSSPLCFDDPFDVERDFELGLDIRRWEDRLSRILCECDHNVPLRAEEVGALIEQAKRISAEIKKLWGGFLPELRILCVSAVYDNTLMWSTYADSHRGVVLGFECMDYSSQWWAAKPVAYQDLRPMLATERQWIKHLRGEGPLALYDWGLYEPLTLTKTKDWAYQQEWRIVSFAGREEPGLYNDYPFNPRELCSVHLGAAIREEDAHDILSRLKGDLSHVVAWRGRRCDCERRVTFEKVDRGRWRVMDR